MASEFDLIERYFKRPVDPSLLGGGDDCALLSVSPGKRLAVSKDLLLEGRHFFSDVDPYLLGHKALAVNLSDLAAMGARPVACMLGLGLPTWSDVWIRAFADGFYSLVDRYQCPLIGGDTTRSQRDIVLSVTVFGEVDDALERAAAYAEAGADISFVEAPESVDEMRRIAAQTHTPQIVNVVIGGKTPALPAKELAAMGFGLVLYANAALQGAVRGMTNALQHLQQHGELAEDPLLVATFAERQSLVQKPFFDALDKKYA